MKTRGFVELKNKLVVGAKLKLTRHDWLSPDNAKLKIGDVREIVKKQSNAIQFEGGSWWYFPRSTDVLIDEDLKGYSVVLNAEKGQFMSYEFVE